MRVVTAVVAGWLLCGVLAYGAVRRSLVSQFPAQAWINWQSDASFSAMYLVLGPLGLGAAAVTTGGFYRGFLFLGNRDDWWKYSYDNPRRIPFVDPEVARKLREDSQ